MCVRLGWARVKLVLGFGSRFPARWSVHTPFGPLRTGTRCMSGVCPFLLNMVTEIPSSEVSSPEVWYATRRADSCSSENNDVVARPDLRTMT